jgi:hypothetical protein
VDEGEPPVAEDAAEVRERDELLGAGDGGVGLAGVLEGLGEVHSDAPLAAGQRLQDAERALAMAEGRYDDAMLHIVAAHLHRHRDA